MENTSNASTAKICCMCCSDKFLMLGRESGVLHCYDVLGLRQEAKEPLHCRPHGNFSRFIPETAGTLEILVCVHVKKHENSLVMIPRSRLKSTSYA